MLLAAGGAFMDQAAVVRPGAVVPAGGAAKAVGPARLEQVRPALRVGSKVLAA